MHGPVFQLIYASRASEGLAPAQLESLRDAAARHNALHGVTGALLYGGGMFVQLLEGDRDVVRGIYDFRVRSASQHSDVTLLHEGPAERRSAGHWSMALLDLNRHAGSEVAERFEQVVASMQALKEDENNAVGVLDVFQLAVLSLSAEAA
ncbi:MAG: BLUF domain-containing protein [Planctomycetota bacterium]